MKKFKFKWIVIFALSALPIYASAKHFTFTNYGQDANIQEKTESRTSRISKLSNLLDIATDRFKGSIFIDVGSESSVDGTEMTISKFIGYFPHFSYPEKLLCLSKGLFLNLYNDKSLMGFINGPASSEGGSNLQFEALNKLSDDELEKAASGIGLESSNLSEQQRLELVGSDFVPPFECADFLAGNTSINFGIGLSSNSENSQSFSKYSVYQIPAVRKKSGQNPGLITNSVSNPFTEKADFESGSEKISLEGAKGQIMTLTELIFKIQKDSGRLFRINRRFYNSLIYLRGPLTVDQDIKILTLATMSFEPVEQKSHKKLDPTIVSRFSKLAFKNVVHNAYYDSLLKGEIRRPEPGELAKNNLINLYPFPDSSVNFDGLRLTLYIGGADTGSSSVSTLIPFDLNP